ncbi:choice-of-anchor I family protein [Halopseudomonas nanhaiensis]|uniref:choice-of-anchor I family protein n=1 Tax=Halopseudomonas nanhaiensis TaxID=2830842 RepID=UPI001CBF8AEA|nr:choice-of-anchor I family protein [Halopseudomonas nanhaiensis]UAW97149.1 choice-of-anchor I family protein [Halopseudomonas nanhaiensis]
MQKWIMTATAAAVLAALAGCNSDSSDDPAPVAPAPTPAPEVTTPDRISLSLLGRYSSGVFDASAAEIPAFDPVNRQIFIVNAQKGAIDIIDASDATAPELVKTLTVEDIAPGAVVNSVAYRDGLIAVAIEADDKTDPGYVGLYDAATHELLDSVMVGSLPDMLTFTPDGRYILVANEAEPSDDYSSDPEGSISIVALAERALGAVSTATFESFNGREAQLLEAGVRLYGPNADVASRNLEPEYIAVSTDSTKAWVALQENNALAMVDIESATVTDIVPLGTKVFGVNANGIDASDDDGEINIRAWPGVVGMYQPDSIAGYTADDQTYLVTANEGDARAWGEDNDQYWAGDASQGFVEEFRVKHLVHVDGFDRRAGDDLPPQLRGLAAGALLNADTFSYCGATQADPGDCRADNNLGRLNITWVEGYRKDAAGAPLLFDATGTENPAGDRLVYDRLYAYGGRSFSIWGADGALVWDSGNAIEQYLASDACRLGSDRSIPCATYFNSGHDEGDAFDSRSDAKGPEPEGLTLGKLGDKTFAFVGLERMGGIMAYDITNPQAPEFMDYFNSRDDWTLDPETNLPAAGDLGPEGLLFVSADDSPTGDALLVVGNEVSGTTAIYRIEQISE